MKRSTAIRFKIATLFMVYFLLVSILLFLNGYLLRLGVDKGGNWEANLALNFLNYIAGGIAGGLILALFELFLLQNLLRRYGLLILTLGRALFFTLVYIVIVVLLAFYYNIEATGKGPFASEVLDGVKTFLQSPEPLLNLVFYLVFATILVFFHQVAGIVGRGVMGKFLFARYREPKVVQQVFLFLDINSSTTIAETIGHVRFFAMIQDFLVEAGAEILEHGGEIYKYVGDEIIAIWNVESGARHARALHCVLSISDRIQSKSEQFLERYGVVPDFKSGIHVGEAMVGELGDWKREVAYMGDVINTTARIQGACKKLQARVLISDEYYRLIIDNTRFSAEFVGKGRLRGKEEPVGLYRMNRAAVSSRALDDAAPA